MRRLHLLRSGYQEAVLLDAARQIDPIEGAVSLSWWCYGTCRVCWTGLPAGGPITIGRYRVPYVGQRRRRHIERVRLAVRLAAERDRRGPATSGKEDLQRGEERYERVSDARLAQVSHDIDTDADVAVLSEGGVARLGQHLQLLVHAHGVTEAPQRLRQRPVFAAEDLTRSVTGNARLLLCPRSRVGDGQLDLTAVPGQCGKPDHAHQLRVLTGQTVGQVPDHALPVAAEADDERGKHDMGRAGGGEPLVPPLRRGSVPCRGHPGRPYAVVPAIQGCPLSS